MHACVCVCECAHVVPFVVLTLLQNSRLARKTKDDHSNMKSTLIFFFSTFTELSIMSFFHKDEL